MIGTPVNPYGGSVSMKTTNALSSAGGGKDFQVSPEAFLSFLMAAGGKGESSLVPSLGGNLPNGGGFPDLLTALRGVEGDGVAFGEEGIPEASAEDKGAVSETDWKALLGILQQLGIFTPPSDLHQGNLLSILPENSAAANSLLSRATEESGGGTFLASGEVSKGPQAVVLKALLQSEILPNGNQMVILSLVKNLLALNLEGTEAESLLFPDRNQAGQTPISQTPIGQNEGALLLKLLFSLKDPNGSLLFQGNEGRGEVYQGQREGLERFFSMLPGDEKSLPLSSEGGTGKDGEGRAKGNGYEATKAGFYQLLGEWRGKPDAPPAVKETTILHAQQFKEELSRFLLNQVKMTRLPDGTSEAHLKLFPEQLGSLDVKIAMHRGIMQATFIVDTLQGKELLEQNLAHLRHQLVQQGIQVDKMEILTPKELPYSQQTWQREGEERRRSPYPWRTLDKEYDGEEDFSDLITSPLTLG